ncbi:MAG TPA: ABC transporter permease [Cyclobacteriaceae bacterium]|nr:ABC transporter permease [Cyclobacteriaceae bacterium]
MLPYTLKLALRHFFRRRIYSSIIVMSLTVGFACTCLLVSFLIAESNADSFHPKKDRIYEITSSGFAERQGRIAYTFRETHGYLLNYPEVENACQVSDVQRAEILIGENATSLNVIAVDTSFFSMFDFPLVAGIKKVVPGGMMITTEKAQQLFGTQDVLGRTIDIRGGSEREIRKEVTITGIVGKPREKSHLRFDGLISMAVFDAGEESNRPGGANYVLLRENTDPVEFMTKYNKDPLRPTIMGPGKMDFILHPITEAYFLSANTLGFMQTRGETFIWVGWIVCGLILFMAGFNFVNLFLLSIQERKRETGIQKTLGISLWQTLRAAATEATVYIGVSVVLSAVLTSAIMPLFNNALTADVEFTYMSRLQPLAIIVSIIAVLMFIVIVLTTIKQRRTVPVSMMRNVSAKVRFSKLFFTLQFFVSITLCVCSVTIIKQMKFVEESSVGFNRNILQMNAPRNEKDQRITEFKNRLLQIPEVEHAAQASGNPISGNMIIAFTWEGKEMSSYAFEGDENFAKALDLQLVEGTLELKNVGDKLVNESLVKLFDMKDPIGMRVPGVPKSEEHRIVGVVKDFTCVSFKTEIPPVIISYKASAKNLLVDYGGNDLSVLLPKLKTAWTEFFPDYYFDYKVIQDDLMKKYSEESLFYKVVLAASITTMVISCFGLFALSWAVIRSRAKEMSIRKVFGAGAANILGLLTVSFAKRLLLAFILAVPVGYYVMNLWLTRFVYKVEVDSWVFVTTGGALAIIAIVTLGIQTLKASLSSPLKDIKE